ncbi:hypothetical protein KLPMCK396B_23460 [Klebsiella pneumoniae]
MFLIVEYDPGHYVPAHAGNFGGSGVEPHITYIRNWQGWLYLAVVIDLFARNVVGWTMKPLSLELAMDVLMMAVWRRKPDGEVIVHSDQGSQYGSDDWQCFCRANNLARSMSRQGNCQDNAVTDSFFS